MIDVSEIAERLNDQAMTLAPELLPNGHRSGNRWMFSGIDDTGKSESAWVTLTGARIGHWRDMGSCRAGEDKGDMLDLLALRRFGGDMRAAVQAAKARLGIVDHAPGYKPDRAEIERRAAEARRRAEAREEAEAADREKKAKGARGLWISAAPIAGGGAEAYLRGRDLEPNAEGEWPGSFRFRDDVPCGPLGHGVKVPALLCSIVSPAGVQIGTHRIFIRPATASGCLSGPDGAQVGRTAGSAAHVPWVKRTDIPKAKMVLGNMWGGFIPINKGASGKSLREMPEGEPIYVTEGPEDAVVVRMMKPAARIICAISLPNIGGIVLPPQARRLVVVADRDDKATAQDALERAIGQQQSRGVAVSLVLPPPPHKDMNDWLRAWKRERSAEKRRRA